MKLLVAGVALLGAGCTPPPESTPPPARECNAAAAQRLVGRQRSEALVREAQRLSHANAVRVLRLGQIVTMEYRADRVNIHLDARDRIERIVCG